MFLLIFSLSLDCPIGFCIYACDEFSLDRSGIWLLMQTLDDFFFCLGLAYRTLRTKILGEDGRKSTGILMYF